MTKKQLYESAKHYISSRMFLIDGDALGGIDIPEEDIQNIVNEINYQAKKIANGRNIFVSPQEILDHIDPNKSEH